MPTVPLPDDPDIQQLRKQAKELRDQSRRGVPEVLELVAECHPKGAHAVSLSGAQLVVARHYGFASWARLKHHLEVVDRYRRAPDDVAERPDPADEFLRLACLRYGDDDAPARWEQARQLLAAHPAFPATSLPAAAATSDVAAVQSGLESEPSSARAEGGPYGWEPLMYLAYARHDPDVSENAVLTTARLLLDHGADPNAGYLWHGMPSPFTVLTGVFGSGELGSARQPAHPHAAALASLLLDAGADPNDGQALYNRQFEEDDSHLELLLARGLGRGDGGPWRARLGPAIDTPTELVRRQLWWAIVRGMEARVRLLVRHGVDFRTPYSTDDGRVRWVRPTDGLTPAEVAVWSGSGDVASYLVEQGAPPPALDEPKAFIAAALAADRAAVDKVRGFADQARADRPGLVVWAAARRKVEAIPLLVDLGFDVSALGRSDVPLDDPWETALHAAASQGDTELIRLLLRLGADPNVRDARFDAPPLGWAHHFEQDGAIALLAPVTAAGPSGR
jgi:ankyrin repeat protein